MVRGEVYCWHCHCVNSCHYVTLFFAVDLETSTSEAACFVAHVTTRQQAQCCSSARTQCSPAARLLTVGKAIKKLFPAPQN